MNYRHLFPFDEYQLQTPLNQEEVREKIESILEGERTFLSSFVSRNTKPYEGKLTVKRFDISRIISYRNSFQPQIQGRIVPSAGGCTLYISMRPHLFGLIFMLFWLGVAGMVCLGITVSLFTHWRHFGEGFSLPSLIPFGMFAFGYGMLMIGYRTESRKSKAFLRELLQVQQG